MAYSVKDTVHIEGRVHIERAVEDVVPQIASGVVFDALTRERKFAGWRIREVFVHVIAVVALVRLGLQLR